MHQCQVTEEILGKFIYLTPDYMTLTFIKVNNMNSANRPYIELDTCQISKIFLLQVQRNPGKTVFFRVSHFFVTFDL